MPHSEPETTPEQPAKFYLTTPIYYVNARPHIGHAYTTIVADVLARRHRLLGHETFFLTGTDEHGQKIERSAAAAGIPPQQFADTVSQTFRNLWDRMGLTYDRFLRTTSDPHKLGAQTLFAELFRLGHIYLSSYTGSYCVSDEAFVDLPPSTPCPDCGRPLETVTEENFFFRLSAFQLPLLDLIESNTLRITPEASRNEVLSFLRGDLSRAGRTASTPDATDPEARTPTAVILSEAKDPRISSAPPQTSEGAPSMTQSDMGGNGNTPSATPQLAQTAAGHPYLPGALKDLSISRSSFTWGIPVPEPAASLTQAPQVIYVWLDALANYMTAIGYGNPDPAAQHEFEKWWPADLHLVGKEITRFHCIYWPAFLLALNPAIAPAAVATETSPAKEAVILSEAKDPRISSFPQATTKPQGAPSMTQSALGGNVNPPPAPTWATPQAEWSPEEHGLPPEPNASSAPTPVVILSEAKDPRISPFSQPATRPEGAPSMPQSGMGGNVNPPPAPTWATPQAEWSPEEHGLPPEPNASFAPTPVVILSEAKDPRILPGAPQTLLTPEAHATWAQLWLPKQITANGWLLFDNSKMSKSKGNVVRTETILDAFGTLCPPKPTPQPEGAPSMTQSGMGGNVNPPLAPIPPLPQGQGAPFMAQSDMSGNVEPSLAIIPPTPHDRDLFAADVLRYYLLREIPFGQDGSFSFDALVTRYNADLANGYGNLVSRTLNLIMTTQGGLVPKPWQQVGHNIWILDRDVQGLSKTHIADLPPPTLSSTAVLADAAVVTAHFAGLRFVQNNFAASQNEVLFRREGDVATPTGQAGVLDWIFEFIAGVNDFLTQSAPWKLAKSAEPEDRSRAGDVLYEAAESIRILTALLHPILPHATTSVWAQLGLGSIEEAAQSGKLKDLTWGGLQPGTKLGPLGPIFPRADKSLIETMTNMEIANTPALTPITDNNDRTHPDTSPFPEAPLASASTSTLTDELAGTTTPTPTRSFDPAAGPRPLSPANPGATVAGSHATTTERPGTPSHTEANPSGIFAGGPFPVAPQALSSRPEAPSAAREGPASPPDQSPEITIDDFAKIDLRVAQILLCERIPKADKLLRLEVDLGPLGRRQILSGIAEHYPPESLIGRRIIVIANLAPRKMRGLESHGMLLAANGPELDGKPGKPILATTADDTPLGTRLK